jgi:hypothetical protein
MPHTVRRLFILGHLPTYVPHRQCMYEYEYYLSLARLKTAQNPFENQGTPAKHIFVVVLLHRTHKSSHSQSCLYCTLVRAVITRSISLLHSLCTNLKSWFSFLAMAAARCSRRIKLTCMSTNAVNATQSVASIATNRFLEVR